MKINAGLVLEARKEKSWSQEELAIASGLNLAAKKDWVNCSFCGKWEYELRKLIAGPAGVFVCDECVELCHGIIGYAET